jgi:hypothetical protein
MKILARIVVIFSTLCALMGAQAAFAAETTYLRPNADVQLDRWSVVGATTAWDALNDAVTETQVATSTDYVKNASKQGWLAVGLSSLWMPGRKVVKAVAWFYTPNSGALELAVNSNSQQLAITSINSAGWHSVSVPLTGPQAQLDDLQFVFKPTNTAEHQVLAAFLRLDTEANPGIYWGAWIDGDTYNSPGDAPWDSAVWNTFEGHTGKLASIVHFGQRPPWDGQPLDEELLDKVTSRGAIPLIDVANDFPWLNKHVSLQEIKEGKADASFAAWASEAKTYAKPFFLRFDWEMNGTWFPWSKEMVSSGNLLYADAWRHLHDVAESVKATNINWVWCPNVLFPGEILNFNQLYPGDSYVDWTCMDGYNRGTNQISPEGWRSFTQIFSATYESLLSQAPSKPIMVGEVASTEVGGSKAAWITDALQTQLPLNFPKVEALVWFNWNIKEDSGLRWDWPIESSASSTSSFAQGIASPYYAGNSFGNLTPLSKIQPLP